VTRRAAFKQSDVTRLVKGALAAGVPVGSFKIAVDNGRVELLPVSGADAQPPAGQADEDWDKALGLT
jgi:hypothetical protein